MLLFIFFKIYTVLIGGVFTVLKMLRHSPGPGVKTLPLRAGGESSIPGCEAEIPPALWPKNQNIKQEQYCRKIQ